MAYRIEENCVGCRVCAQKCPMQAIRGEAKQLHIIDAVACIDCGVCASFCPVEECIFDPHGFAAAKIKPVSRPVAVVYAEQCTGCADCVDICPVRCLKMVAVDGAFFRVVRLVDAKACTGCKECERVCSDKRAIRVEWPDGAWCAALGEVPVEYVAPRKAGAAAVR